ncbi:DUF1232 domain-containing protein [Leptolyngbya sp. GGD]|uniref:DUF1232 domain-containing protein n=1 Tax=Leptolyngbya sp. GGD TaxID=2997907 RepID=UPI00227CFCFF|nr:DUF1232 domain-containing protein [Leptolyngbya sp. GGD]MCY6492298.1 DUF1232 domain-containing protein [Leptolyngbya sp. GGD]
MVADTTSDQGYKLEPLQGFPWTLFAFKQYDGGRAMVALLFLFAGIYFLSGFWGFLLDHNAWLHDLVVGSKPVVIDSQPSIPWWKFWKHIQHNPITEVLTSTISYIDIVFRLFIFMCAYCLAWATFDPKNIEGYVLGIFNAFLGGAYVLSPTDVIPDFLPVVGSFDDTILGVGMVILGVSGWYRTKLRDIKTKTILELVNHGNNERALQLLLEDKGISIRGNAEN